MKKFWMAAFGCAAMSFLAPSAYADSYDLTGGGSATDTDGEAMFVWVDQQSTGTGVIDPFVRIQHTGAEEGVNTDGRPLLYDENSSAQFTHSITTGEIPIVNIGGTDYLEFLLDINQVNAGDNHYLSLNEIEIWLVSGGTTELTDMADIRSAGTLAWSLDEVNGQGTGGDTIELDYALNPGSGAGDMFLYVKADNFGADGDQIYFYSQFGDPGNSSNDGFEEWAVRLAEDDGGNGEDPVPEPGTFALVALCAAGAVVMRRRKNAQQ